MTQPAPPSSYILRDLKEVGLPDHVSWMPQTLGWKILAFLLLIVLIYFSYKKVRHWWLNRYRDEAIKVTKGLSIDDPKFEYKLFVITKRVMGHLDPKLHTLFGNEFVTVLVDFPMQKQIQLKEGLGASWTLALSSQRNVMNNEDRQALKQYCLDWFKLHQLKEKK